jgi:cytochrome c oxidase subunit 2
MLRRIRGWGYDAGDVWEPPSARAKSVYPVKSLSVLTLSIIGTVAGAVLGVLLIVLTTLPEQASVQASDIDYLYDAFLLFSGIIFGIVVLVMLVAVVRFRARPNDDRDGSNTHGITWLEIVWTVIPFILVALVAFFSWNILNEGNVTGAAQKSGQHVHIIGYQYGWKYTYLNEDIGIKESPDLVVPVNVPIAFDITTMDVMHSFWVPAWRMQMGATPAQTNYTSITPNKIGEYDIVCAFLCGTGHTQMNSAVDGGLVTKVRVVSQADFDAWVTETKAKAAAA